MSRFARLGDERGSVLLIAIAVLMLVLALGTVALATTSVQSHQTGVEAAGERAFNLAESALNAEASLLEIQWPATAATAYPVCNQGSTPSSTCPAGSVTAGYNTTYAGTGYAVPPATWSVQVVDDNGAGGTSASYYSDNALSSGQLAAWDSNADNKLWIRADATVLGQHRIVVAEIVRQVSVVSLPQNVITAGGVSTENNGNKIIIEGTDPNSGLTGAVDIRCTDSTGPASGDWCAGWNASHGQLDPASDYQMGYVDPGGNYQTLSSATINELRQTAEAEGTYYPAGTCPPLGQTGLLFVEDDTSNPCVYNGEGGTTWNSNAAPGAFIVAKGTLTFNANITYYGVIYMVNEQGTVPSSGPCTAAQQNTVFTVHGGGALYGGVFVDRCGTVDAGEAKYDINYDTAAFGGVKTFTTPSLALSTFKIVPNSGS